MRLLLATSILLLGFVTLSEAQEEREEPPVNVTAGIKRNKKLLSVFQIVTFDNNPCQGSGNKNGTCYTDKECENKGGKASGTCAEGYGVCCVFTLSCGGRSNDNCTYLEQTSTTTSLSTCQYTICKCNKNVCRLRLDFENFALAAPQSAINNAANTAALATASGVRGGSIGDCLTDTFSVSSPGGNGSPVICGANTGQHMYVDASDACNMVSIALGSGDTSSRQWNIKVRQFECGDPLAGPDNCLQYFMEDTGTIRSFNFPTTGAVSAATATHLSNQCYSICIRQNKDKCTLCLSPTTAVAAPAIAAQNSFGLSASATANAAKSATGTRCTTDYLEIPGALKSALFMKNMVINAMETRICGRIFESADNLAATVTVCTQSRPFRLTFKTDSNEATSTIMAMQTLGETQGFPAGTLGFSLDYTQGAC